MSSYSHKDKWYERVYLPNPIVQSGVNFTLRIDLDDSYFKIFINEAIHPILYQHRLPGWATEWIEISGNIIDNIKIGKYSEKCKLHSKPNIHNLNIIQVPESNHLKDGSLVIIHGKITEEPILITFLHQALKWDAISK
uniref:Galectin n=1 Tax=Meloidogyne enterolobii TaxID=390850 RepID=A0A6V7XHU0_MELEN|nr:unnamed protein product [Meloidogyne enterolobii]